MTDKPKKAVFVIDGVEVDANGRPLAEAGKPGAASTEVDTLREQLATAEKERDHLDQLLKGTADEVLKRVDYLRVPRADNQNPDGMDVRQAVAAGFDDLKAELDKTRAQLAEAQARPVLPADARKRLVALPKIGDKLADEVLAALGAEAAPQPAPEQKPEGA